MKKNKRIKIIKKIYYLVYGDHNDVESCYDSGASSIVYKYI